MAGAAKRGPDLWSSRHQLQDIADDLPSHGPDGAGALLILAVSATWAADAHEMCDSITTTHTVMTVWTPT
jgi:hypothetical protein